MEKYISRCPFCGGRMVAEFYGEYGDAMYINLDGTISSRRARRFWYGHNGDEPLVYCFECRRDPKEYKPKVKVKQDYTTNKELALRSKDWQDGWRAYQQGDTIKMSHEEYLAKSDEWKEGAKYAAENPVGIMAYPQ